MSDADTLIDEAAGTPFRGWDFGAYGHRGYLRGMPWSYPDRVDELMAGATRMLDLGTGGGEFLLDRTRLARVTVATEAWPPNVPVAGEKLAGVASVVQVESAPDNADQGAAPATPLPFADGTFDLIIDRHESFCASEVMRVLRPGGSFCTQQVGRRNEDELRGLFSDNTTNAVWELTDYVDQLTGTGFDVTRAEEAFPDHVFEDVGALVYYLRAIPWAVPSFDVEVHRDVLHALHDSAPIVVRDHRLLLEAHRPEDAK